MKRTIIILLAGLFFLVSCAQPAETPAETTDPVVTPEPSKPDPAIPEEPNDDVDKDTIYQNFVTKLTKETVDRKLNWDNVFNIVQENEEDAFNYILTSNEFHTVYELQSYGLVDEEGITVFLLNEDIESGIDGSVSKERNLYIVKGIDGESFKLPLEDKDLDKLESKVKYYFETEGADLDELDALIKDYLGEE